MTHQGFHDLAHLRRIRRGMEKIRALESGRSYRRRPVEEPVETALPRTSRDPTRLPATGARGRSPRTPAAKSAYRSDEELKAETRDARELGTKKHREAEEEIQALAENSRAPLDTLWPTVVVSSPERAVSP